MRSDNMSAMRSATCLAARRLGSSMRILPSEGRNPAMTVSGRRVDFPAPGGAVKTTQPLAVNALLTSAAISVVGNEAAFLIMSLNSIIVSV